MPFPKGMPLPIPFLQWIIWSTEFLVKSGINLDITAEYDETEESEGKPASDKISLDLSLNSNSSASILFSLQSFWTAYIENTDKKYEVKNTASEMHGFYFGEILQDIAKSAEFNLFVELSLNTDAKMGPKFEYDFAKEQDAFSVSLGDAGGGLGMLAPAGAHIGVFKWDYTLASAEIVTVTKNEGVFFNKLTFLSNTWNMPQIVRWGRGRLYDYVLLFEADKNREYVIGDHIKLALSYKDIDSIDSSNASITFIDKGGSVELKAFSEPVVQQISNFDTIKGQSFSHKSLLDFSIKVLDEASSAVSLSNNDGSLLSGGIGPFIESLANGQDVELSASFDLNGDLRDVDRGKGAVILAPKIIKSDGLFDHGRKELIFKIKIDNFNDDYLWVRFKEKDLIRDDVLKFKSSSTSHTEWNILKLENNGSDFIIRAKLNDFENLDLEFAESELIIYPQIALARGDDFIISEDVDIEPVNVKESMIPA